MSNMGKLDVGDAVASVGNGRRALTVAGPGGWFALTCRPQAEGDVERWLARHGVYAFHPVLARQVRVRGHLRSYERRYLPGYVFARFRSAPVPYAVLACPMLTGALALSSGQWGRLDAGRMGALHAMRSVDAAKQAQAALDRSKRRAAALLRSGDGALFRSGPMAGHRCEVVSLTAEGGAVVELSLFGRPARVEASASDLVKVATVGVRAA